MYALSRITGEMSPGLLGSSPIAKEIEDFASDRSSRDGQPPGRVIKKQSTISPIGQQASGAPQLDPFPRLFEPPSTLAGAALELFHRPSVFFDINAETSSL